MITVSELVQRAYREGLAIPGFNIPYLPMMQPVVAALRESRTVGLIMVARLEWEKFEAQSLDAVKAEYDRVADQGYTRLHLDHTPVIDEDGAGVDYMAIINSALTLGYDSVMIDGSRLSFEDNCACTRQVVDQAHGKAVPVEAELGAVMGHESGPMPSYETLFTSKKGFTDPDEASRFVSETGVDWLSVAVGSIHGAISAVARKQKKPAARLDLEHLEHLRRQAGVPLVLHGGSGIHREYVQAAIRQGIAKINVATTLRQAYEKNMETSAAAAADAVYDAVMYVVREELKVAGSADVLLPED